MEISEEVSCYINRLFNEKFPDLTVLHITPKPFGVKVYVKRENGLIQMYTIHERVIIDGIGSVRMEKGLKYENRQQRTDLSKC